MGWVGLPSHSNHEVLDTGLIRRHAGEVSHTAGALEGVIVPPNGHVNLVPRKRSVRGVRVCVCVRACDKQSYSLQQQRLQGFADGDVGVVVLGVHVPGARGTGSG